MKESEFQGEPDLVAAFSGMSVTVVGDAMLDEYVFVSEQAADSGMPVLKRLNKFAAPGGAACVACIAAALGARVTFLGVVGSDATGEALVELLSQGQVNTEHLTSSRINSTIKKRRFSKSALESFRIDQETKVFD